MPRFCGHLSSLLLPMSAIIWVVNGACPQRLNLLILKRHKTVDRGPLLGIQRDPGALLSVEHPSLFMLLPLHSYLCQLLQHLQSCGRRGCKGESGRGCCRTSYMMHFPPTSNGVRGPSQRLDQLWRGCAAGCYCQVLVRINWKRHMGSESQLRSWPSYGIAITQSGYLMEAL